MKKYIINLKTFFKEKRELQKGLNIFRPDYKNIFILLGIVFGGLSLLFIYGCFIGGAGVKNEPLSERIFFFAGITSIMFVLVLFWLIVGYGEHVAIYDKVVIKRLYFIFEQRIAIDEIKDCMIISAGSEEGDGVLTLKIISRNKKKIKINIFLYPYESVRMMCLLMGYEKLIE